MGSTKSVKFDNSHSENELSILHNSTSYFKDIAYIYMHILCVYMYAATSITNATNNKIVKREKTQGITSDGPRLSGKF